jgi:hypothetical protein
MDRALPWLAPWACSFVAIRTPRHPCYFGPAVRWLAPSSLHSRRVRNVSCTFRLRSCERPTCADYLRSRCLLVYSAPVGLRSCGRSACASGLRSRCLRGAVAPRSALGLTGVWLAPGDCDSCCVLGVSTSGWSASAASKLALLGYLGFALQRLPCCGMDTVAPSKLLVKYVFRLAQVIHQDSFLSPGFPELFT